MTAGWRPSGGSTISEVKPNVRVPHSLRKNVSVVAARVAPVYCWTARARNCSCGSDSWVASACGRSRGMPRMSSVLYVPARAGSPHDVRGAFQFGFLASAVCCSAGVRRSAGNCAISSAVGARAGCPPGPAPGAACPRCAPALGGPSPSCASSVTGTEATSSAAIVADKRVFSVMWCSPRASQRKSRSGYSSTALGLWEHSPNETRPKNLQCDCADAGAPSGQL